MPQSPGTGRRPRFGWKKWAKRYGLGLRVEGFRGSESWNVGE